MFNTNSISSLQVPDLGTLGSSNCFDDRWNALPLSDIGGLDVWTSVDVSISRRERCAVQWKNDRNNELDNKTPFTVPWWSGVISFSSGRWDVNPSRYQRWNGWIDSSKDDTAFSPFVCNIIPVGDMRGELWIRRGVYSASERQAGRVRLWLSTRSVEMQEEDMQRKVRVMDFCGGFCQISFCEFAWSGVVWMLFAQGENRWWV